MHWLGSGFGAVLGAVLVASPIALDAGVAHSNQAFAQKKRADAASVSGAADFPLLATLVQTHTDERVPLDALNPDGDRFSALLTDRVTGERHDLDPRLLDLLRSLSAKHVGARIELVSGYRSPKLNEMLRKKGHHVASHSQHSLGHAVDFRLIEPDGDPKGMVPAEVEKEIRALGWVGGVGTYPLQSDWFVHADVGPNRRWLGN